MFYYAVSPGLAPLFPTVSELRAVRSSKLILFNQVGGVGRRENYDGAHSRDIIRLKLKVSRFSRFSSLVGVSSLTYKSSRLRYAFKAHLTREHGIHFILTRLCRVYKKRYCERVYVNVFIFKPETMRCKLLKLQQPLCVFLPSSARSLT